jgi:membrane protein implicated in regulation of membrane protease activity
MAMFWLILFAVLLVIEIFTMGLTTIWFAGGALIAALGAWIGFPLWLQIVLFVLVSVALLIFTRPITVKYFNKSRTRTNADRAIGEHAVVAEKIDNLLGVGRVMIKGVDWSARAEDDTKMYDVGQTVTVVRIEGVTAIVE